MTTNKPEVVAWYFPSSKTTLPVVSLNAGNGQPLIRLSDYEALQAECENLRSIISDLKYWDCDVSGGFLSIPVDLRSRMQKAIDAAIAAYRKQGGES